MIRTAESDADYETVARIYAEVEPDDAVSPEQLKTSTGTTLLHEGGGFGYVVRSSVTDACLGMVRVRPAARRRGIGSGLLAAVAREALVLDRHRIWGRVHEDDAESRRFVS